MNKPHLLQLLEQVRDQEGDWREALEDAIDMVDTSINSPKLEALAERKAPWD